MLIGYMRVSKSDGSQNMHLQRDALIGTGLMLFVISFAVNLVARVIVARTGPDAKGRKTKRRVEQLPPSDPSSILLVDAEAGPLHAHPTEGSQRA